MNAFRIHRVAKLTGLSRDVIRIWERRYGLLKPARGANRYRIYTDEDVALLRFIKEKMQEGESIGDLAKIGREELLRRIPKEVSTFGGNEMPSYEKLLVELLHALDPFDRTLFERRLNEAVAVLPFEEALHGILLPFQVRVGDAWHEGSLGIGIEHFVTNLVQQKIFSAMNQLPIPEFGPKVVVACPDGEAHEVGAQAVAYHCGLRGCRVSFLGGNVPMNSLSQFCTKVNPSLVLFSIPVVLSKVTMESLLEQLQDQFHSSWNIAAGGNGAIDGRTLLEERRIKIIETFQDLDKAISHLQGQVMRA